MTKENLINTLSQGETLTVEFKKCYHELSDFVFESVCAFLNRAGGHIFLNIDDNRAVLGLSRDQVGTKSGLSRDQVGIKPGLSRCQAGVR